MKHSKNLTEINEHINTVYRQNNVRDAVKAYEDAAEALKTVDLKNSDLLDQLRAGMQPDNRWAMAMQQANDATDENGSYLFKCNGYAAVINGSGLIAIRSELIDNPDPLQPDPVVEQYGEYSSMAIIKALRGEVYSRHRRVTEKGVRSYSGSRSRILSIVEFGEKYLASPWTLGFAAGADAPNIKPFSAGVTGALFMYGTAPEEDIRAKLLTMQILSKAVGPEVPEVDRLAGLADQIKADLVRNAIYQNRARAYKVSVSHISSRGADFAHTGQSLN